MIKHEIEVSTEQIEKMKHCIGFNHNKIKNGKYLAWRNYFITGDSDKNWDNLVLQDLAVKRPFKLGKGANPQCYSVSKEGFKFLENQLNIQIIIDRR